VSLFALVAAAGVALGWARGGRLVDLQTVRLREAWLVPLAVVPQLLLVFLPPQDGVEPLRLAIPISTVVLAWFVLANLHLTGMWLVLAGLALNLAVVVANGGLMPTNQQALAGAGMAAGFGLTPDHPGTRLPKTKDTVLPLAQTRLWPLSDTLVSPPLPRRHVMSVGDLLIGAGTTLAIAGGMRRRVRRAPAAGAAERAMLAEAVAYVRRRRLTA